jgi:glucose-6-phosphate dehydrogenase assembly protein OpcA
MKIENEKIEKYSKLLLEKSRPPSKGGNTEASHMHLITINNIKYSFKALGAKQWIFKADTVSFEYEINGNYKNIIPSTLITTDKNGEIVLRGIRGEKDKLRTADARMPVSRKEMRS